MDIQLNFVNQSSDHNNSEIVIFQKNVADPTSETAVAWIVIKDCGPGWHHPFTYFLQNCVGAKDSLGNYSDLHIAENGQKWDVVLTTSGDQVTLDASHGSSPEAITICNRLQGAIDGYIYKGGKLIAAKTNMQPGMEANFELVPTIWLGVVAEMEEGSIMNPAIVKQLNTEISLLGIAKADIVMTGGGTGAGAKPFQFFLQNVIMA